MSEVQSGGEALGQSLEAFREPTLRERLTGWSMIVGTLVVVVGLTLLATAFLVLMVSDAYTGIVEVSGGGIHGTYVVTEVDVSWRGIASSVGTFTSDDGSVVLTGTKLSWDGSDIGTELPAKYVPSLRDGRLPVVVSQGVPGDIISPTVLAVVTLPIAALGWWFMVAVLIERGRGSAEDTDGDGPSPNAADAVPESS